MINGDPNSPWKDGQVAAYTGANARGDVIIAKYGWVNGVAPLANTLWPANPDGDAVVTAIERRLLVWRPAAAETRP